MRLPHIYRTFTAEIKHNIEGNKKAYLLSIIAFLGILLTSFLIILTLLIIQYIQLKNDRLTELRTLLSFEKLIQKHPEYPELYYEAALHARRLGDKEKALEYIHKALLIRPDFPNGKKLQDELMR